MQTPLLRDLNAIENIALILEYHQSFSIKKAQQIVLKLLKKCHIADIKEKRVYELDKKEILTIKYIRAYVSNFDTITVVKPFSMLDKIADIEILFELFNILNDKITTIADLKSNDYFKEKNVI